jgi:hypothetical protein
LKEDVMTVTIGIDPHKTTHVAVAIDDHEEPIGRVALIADRSQTVSQPGRDAADPAAGPAGAAALHLSPDRWRQRAHHQPLVRLLPPGDTTTGRFIDGGQGRDPTRRPADDTDPDHVHRRGDVQQRPHPDHHVQRGRRPLHHRQRSPASRWGRPAPWSNSPPPTGAAVTYDPAGANTPPGVTIGADAGVIFTITNDFSGLTPKAATCNWSRPSCPARAGCFRPVSPPTSTVTTARVPM